MRHFTKEHKQKLREAKLKNPVRYWLGKKRPEIQNWLDSYTFKKGHQSFNKGLKGYTNAGTFKKGHKGMLGKDNPYFKHGLSKQLKGFYQKRRQIRKRGNGGTHTAEAWLELKAFYNFMCLCCKRFEPTIKLTEDHVIPLAVGGTDSIDNIQPLCIDCNMKKSVKNNDYKSAWSAFNNNSFLAHLEK